jgi:hypothetical protein
MPKGDSRLRGFVLIQMQLAVFAPLGKHVQSKYVSSLEQDEHLLAFG